MKKKIFIGAAVLLLILLLLISFCVSRNLAPGIGIYIEATNGEPMIVKGRSPIVMHGREALFENLETGDLIFVLHNGINTSFPGETGVFFCLQIGNDALTEIPVATLEELEVTGWYKP